MDGEIIPKGRNLAVSNSDETTPAIIVDAGRPALNAWRDFFAELDLQNENTFAAYRHAITRFLEWAGERDLCLEKTMPADVAEYFKKLRGAPSTKKQHRAALKRFFDLLVVRHICVINPVASVKTEKFQVTKGRTAEIEADEIEQLIGSLDTTKLVGLRDRAVIATLTATAARVGAVAKLRRGDYHGRAGRMQLYFREKGGKHKDIEVRHDLEQYLDEYLVTACMLTAAKEMPLFRPVVRRQQRFAPWNPAEPEAGFLSSNDLCRMIKRRMLAAGLRDELTAHSFRVATITNLIGQGIPVEDVQELAGHADARTTKLYDRTNRKATRNLVERISLPI